MDFDVVARALIWAEAIALGCVAAFAWREAGQRLDRTGLGAALLALATAVLLIFALYR